MELKEIRTKIESIGNIQNLTSALETLSALKMKKVQKIALKSRPFAQKTSQLLEKLETVFKEKKSIFFKEEKAENILVMVLTSDRGFCGSLNQNVLRLTEKELKTLELDARVELFPVGKKGVKYFKKRGKEIKLSFFGVGDFGELAEIKPVSDFLIKTFSEGKFQKIYLIYNCFISTFFQRPRVIQLLPLKKENLADLFHFTAENVLDKGKEDKFDFLIEPSLAILAKEIVPQLVEYLIYQSILENNVSEHSARMLAMKSASENAEKKLSGLKLEYNKARQEQITAEVLEISSAKEALE